MDEAAALKILAEYIAGETSIPVVHGSISCRDPGFIVIRCPYCGGPHALPWRSEYEATGLIVPPPCKVPRGADPGVVRAMRIALSGRLIRVVDPFWEGDEPVDLMNEDRGAVPFFSAGLLRR